MAESRFTITKPGIQCDDNWDISDSELLCRQLGFSGAISAPF